jgi:hypothetical protein
MEWSNSVLKTKTKRSILSPSSNQTLLRQRFVQLLSAQAEQLLWRPNRQRQGNSAGLWSVTRQAKLAFAKKGQSSLMKQGFLIELTDQAVDIVNIT